MEEETLEVGVATCKVGALSEERKSMGTKASLKGQLTPTNRSGSSSSQSAPCYCHQRTFSLRHESQPLTGLSASTLVPLCLFSRVSSERQK